MPLDQLRALEAESIAILREVVSEFERPVMRYTGLRRQQSASRDNLEEIERFTLPHRRRCAK